ncbi:ferric reductase-like transmembrane domain-containing protein [Hasllibacter sp. MH4015]|uniref:ferric reductase-like transmembrane domain-containing protein n=1 Tax=Hasllibacter sp. MH4015 TaxID=2854029 RepID=UPI001CD2EA0D|nr:ferric reductase-like transmembrane domain-containing protein [Hasllibacter sp. MH4015]
MPFRGLILWGALAAAIGAALILATQSSYLQYRQPIYIIAGFAGIVGLALLAVQPLLGMAAMPGLSRPMSRRAHRWTGTALVTAVVVHVAGLWITSPPDVVDALTFTSPTPFSVWGVIAMWAVFATALVAMGRRKLRLRVWRLAHGTLALVIVSGTIAHALLIEGTMEPVSKIALCVLAALVTAWAVSSLRAPRRSGPER